MQCSALPIGWQRFCADDGAKFKNSPTSDGSKSSIDQVAKLDTDRLLAVTTTVFGVPTIRYVTTAPNARNLMQVSPKARYWEVNSSLSAATIKGSLSVFGSEFRCLIARSRQKLLGLRSNLLGLTSAAIVTSLRRTK